MVRGLAALLLASLALAPLGGQAAGGLTPEDLFALRSVGDVQVSPDGSRVAYAVVHNDAPGRPYAVVTILDLQTGRSHVAAARVDGPRWAPDGRRLAFVGQGAEGAGLMVSEADGSGARFLAPVADTNHPLPSSGRVGGVGARWPRIAFVSATPGPESDDANGDPMVITRYLYKPTAAEGLDALQRQSPHARVRRRRRHPRRSASSPTGPPTSIRSTGRRTATRSAFVSNREANPDRTFNYDIFSVSARTQRCAGSRPRRAPSTTPVWSPDGTRLAFAGTPRDLTSSETTMEDTHVWVMKADGSQRVEIGQGLDNRQGAPRWSADGRQVYFTLQERGEVLLARLPAAGGAVDLVVKDRGSVGALGRGARAASPTRSSTPEALGALHARPGATAPPERRTTLNAPLLADAGRGRGGGVPLSQRRWHRDRGVPHQAARTARRTLDAIR